MTNDYDFIRTELRVLQSTYTNEEFLNLVSNMIGSRDENIEALKVQIDNINYCNDSEYDD